MHRINYWPKALNNNISTPIIVCHFFWILWTIINVVAPTWKYDGVPSKGNTTFT